MNYINNLFNRYFRVEEKLLFGLMLPILALSLVYCLINVYGSRFSGVDLLTFEALKLLPVMVLLFIVALWVRDISPRASLLTWTYTMYYFIVVICNLMVHYIQLTPFPTIDFALVKIDRFFGFDQMAWLNWTYAHPVIADFVKQCYGLMYTELVIVPMILALLMQRRAIYVLFAAMLISFVIGATIYYFLPTTAPASVFYNPNFTLQQHSTFVKFYQIHHHLPVTTTDGGLIAFPSFHVVWAALLAYAFRHKKYWFYPMMLFNAVIIVSTIMLGWHYFVDVLGGVMLAALSVLIAEWMYKKYVVPASDVVQPAQSLVSAGVKKTVLVKPAT